MRSERNFERKVAIERKEKRLPLLLQLHLLLHLLLLLLLLLFQQEDDRTAIITFDRQSDASF